jgi:hypothetical protein
MGDDTHIPRATSLRSQPLATLAVVGGVALLPAGHGAGAVLAVVRWSGAVPAAVAVVAAAGLALPVRHRLAPAFTLARRLSRNRRPRAAIRLEKLYEICVHQTVLIVNGEPLYPLLVVDPKGWLGWETKTRTSRFSLFGALNTRRWTAFDGSGARWRVSPDSFRYPFTWWTRLLANTIYNPRFEAELRWLPVGQYTFEELQEQLCSLVDKDDDILTQFHDANHIKDTIRATKTFKELTGKLRGMKLLRP